MRVRDDTPPTPRGFSIALIFALAAHDVHTWVEHGQWLSEAQLASLAVDWLNRQKIVLPLAERRRLASLADPLARQIVGSLSREAQLYVAHEMMEALDPNYVSEFAQSLMKECERLLDASAGG